MGEKKFKDCRNQIFLITVCKFVGLAMSVTMTGCQNANQSQQSSKIPQVPVATSSPTSSPTSTPVHVATKDTAYGVTRKAYDMMADGMTKTQCDEIVGFSGEIYKSYQYAAGSGLGKGGNFVRWKKENAEIAAQFDDDSLTMKFSKNLR